MKNQVREKVKKYALDKKKLVVAVSGGVDSVVLLDVLAKELPAKKIVVAHADHGIRKESAGDRLFVEALAEKYGLDFVAEKLDLSGRDEAVARKRRYEWLKKAADENGADYIVVGHNLNDQLETIILKLARGAGPTELKGMRELSGRILRPLLSVSKEKINNYARKNRLKYRFDKSNRDIRYSRNRVRHNIVPELVKINPSLFKTLSGNMELAAEFDDFLKSEVGKLEKKARRKNRLGLQSIRRAEPFLVKTLIKKMLHEYLETGEGIYRKNVEEVFSLIDSLGTKRTSLRGVNVVKSYDDLIFAAEREERPLKKKRLLVGETVDFGGFVLQARVGSASPRKDNLLLPISFSDNLWVRTWRRGDKIRTVSGTKKLQNVFVDAKVSVAERRRWPVVFYGEEIVWVPKLVAGREAKKESKNLIIEVK